ncbi:MAG: hypothetical protein M1840_005632 [Geoglossum simile]|nr:MAG: hypothetical protein M1840_005632 [Geoglossum simile]
MIVNERIAISTSKILLVPYCAHHVPTYHRWMQDKELQELTASEPLTLGEEQAMQCSWRIDGDKLTFILCSQDPVHNESPGENMVGDVNLFLTRDGDSTANSVVGEVELMIAEKRMRGKGLGRASLLAFLKFITLHQEEILGEYKKHGDENERGVLAYLRAKIGEGNMESIGLFESLGFRKVGEEANYFGEVELRIVGLVGEVVDGLMERHGVLGYREVGYYGGL